MWGFTSAVVYGSPRPQSLCRGVRGGRLPPPWAASPALTTRSSPAAQSRSEVPAGGGDVWVDLGRAPWPGRPQSPLSGAEWSEIAKELGFGWTDRNLSVAGPVTPRVPSVETHVLCDPLVSRDWSSRAVGGFPSCSRVFSAP